ncbi:methyltransferase domain-containing protein [Aminipila butyrica]|uniref:Methyltransferase domain-containing protein n=1 Tax=Aminipila butyrica TaxID=433296 RepID=A0A858BVI7_9FIRM|nr:methyltransferase domain-containing protein [Aminipila butyrica]QIB69432.1 methyltransferase domain-containing protein [Aminipila butyrica]
MNNDQYIYNVNYNVQDYNLCAFEVSALFDEKFEDKVLFTNKEVDPSVSPFLKNRIKVIYKEKTFNEILERIMTEDFRASEFMVKYVPMYNRDPNIGQGKKLSKEVGLRIYGYPSFKSPKSMLSITYYQDYWYFGYLKQNNYKWRSHKQKPYSFSSALGGEMGKVLINAASRGDTSKRLIDACCGVGTVILEGVFAGYNICGWEISPKVAELARQNLSHYQYHAKITTGDMKTITEYYDAVIIDLPYNNFSHYDEEKQWDIIKHARHIAKRMIIVTATDIKEKLCEEQLKIVDYCRAEKTIKGDFARYIWICEN